MFLVYLFGWIVLFLGIRMLLIFLDEGKPFVGISLLTTSIIVFFVTSNLIVDGMVRNKNQPIINTYNIIMGREYNRYEYELDALTNSMLQDNEEFEKIINDMSLSKEEQILSWELYGRLTRGALDVTTIYEDYANDKIEKLKE